MQVVVDSSPSEWLAHVSPLLLRAEAENNLLLGLAAQAADQPYRFGDETCYVRVQSDGRVVGAAIVNSYNLILSRQSPDARTALADHLATSEVAVPGVLGPDEMPAEFVELWTARTGVRAALRMEQRIHECRGVAELTPASGRYRMPNEGDVATLAEWRDDFHVAVSVSAVGDDHPAAIRRMMADDRLAVWEHAGEIVSCAATVRRTPNGSVIAFVYTPPHRRGCGYATSCVAELTRRNLAAGDAFCCLYTDLANPVSNAIYARIGYRRVCDAGWWQIDALNA